MNEKIENISSDAFIKDILGQCRESRKLVLLIVAIGLLLDNMLLTSVGNVWSCVNCQFLMGVFL